MRRPRRSATGRVADLPDLLRPGDLLVLDDTRCCRPRFFGRRGDVAVEVTLVGPAGDDAWWALARPGKRLGRRSGGVGTGARSGGAREGGRRPRSAGLRPRRGGAAGGDPNRGCDAAAALYPPAARWRSEGPRRLSERLRQAGRLGRSTHRLAAPDRGDDGSARQPRRRAELRHPPCRPRHLRAGQGRGHLGACDARRVVRGAGGRGAGDRGGATAEAGAWSPSEPRAANPRERRRRGWQAGARRPADPAFRDAGLSVPCRRPPPHQLPPPSLDPLHAGLRLRRYARMQAAYAHAIAPGLSLLQLWRCLPDRPRRGNMTGFALELLARDGAARRGHLTTAHGTIETPAFMPVGTAATVKAMSRRAGPRDRCRDHPRQCLPPDAAARGRADREAGRAATLHALGRAGADRFGRLPGDVAGPAPHAARARRHVQLAYRRLAARALARALDRDPAPPGRRPSRCSSTSALRLPAAEAEVARAMELSLRWAERSRAAFVPRPGHALFGIVQGGTDQALRVRSAEGLARIGFDGYAVGGLAVGEPQAQMLATLDAAVPPAAGGAAPLPDGRRQARGHRRVRSPAASTCSTACCPRAPAAPARPSPGSARSISRTRATPTIRGRWTRRPQCPATRDYSRAYLHHLVKSGEILGAILLTWNNLLFYQELMRRIRDAIALGRLADLAAEMAEGEARGDLEPYPG